MKTKITDTMREELRKEFPQKAYSKHPTKTFLTTLKAMYVTERLNDVFGIGRWSINTEVIERTEDYILLQGEFISMDYEVIVPKQFGGHKTTGKNTEIADGYKSALTDCQSKIASYLEIGIEMFKGNITIGGNTHSNQNTSTQNNSDNKEWLNPNTDKWDKAIDYIKNKNGTIEKVLETYKLSKANKELLLTQSK